MPLSARSFLTCLRLQSCRRQARRTLLGLLHYDPGTRQEGQPGFGAGSGKPDVMFGFLKHLWGTGERVDAFHR